MDKELVYIELNTILDILEGEDYNNKCLESRVRLESFIQKIKFGVYDE